MLKQIITCTLAALALCVSSFAQETPTDVQTPPDSLLVVVDGFLGGKAFKNDQATPLELALRYCPFLSEEDIESVDLLNGANGLIIPCAPPKAYLFITTRKESALHDFILDGKSVHKRRGIGLERLVNRDLLLKEIKKKWGINPKRIDSLEIEGKTIRITTKSKE